MLMERLKAGADFRDLALGYRRILTLPRGGDLGLVPLSQLKQAPPPLRDAVLNKEAGAVNVAQSNGAHALVLVVAHEQAGQRDLSMPPVRDGITQTLRGRKEQLEPPTSPPCGQMRRSRTALRVAWSTSGRCCRHRSRRQGRSTSLLERFIRESAELNGW